MLPTNNRKAQTFGYSLYYTVRANIWHHHNTSIVFVTVLFQKEYSTHCGVSLFWNQNTICIPYLQLQLHYLVLTESIAALTVSGNVRPHMYTICCLRMPWYQIEGVDFMIRATIDVWFPIQNLATQYLPPGQHGVIYRLKNVMHIMEMRVARCWPPAEQLFITHITGRQYRHIIITSICIAWKLKLLYVNDTLHPSRVTYYIIPNHAMNLPRFIRVTRVIKPINDAMLTAAFYTWVYEMIFQYIIRFINEKRFPEEMTDAVSTTPRTINLVNILLTCVLFRKFIWNRLLRDQHHSDPGSRGSSQYEYSLLQL